MTFLLFRKPFVVRKENIVDTLIPVFVFSTYVFILHTWYPDFEVDMYNFLDFWIQIFKFGDVKAKGKMCIEKV